MSSRENAMTTTTANTVTIPARPATAAPETRWHYRPNADIVDLGDAYEIVLDVPGAKPADIEITHERNVLTVRASVPPRGEAHWQPVRVEYGVGDYFRQFETPDTINSAGISATCADGLLRVRLPKLESARPRLIAVSGPEGSRA